MSGFKWLNQDGFEIHLDHKDPTQSYFDNSTLIVGQNIKHDLHWARRIGVDISNVCVWDTQIAEFLFSKQSKRYPSLNYACEKYNLPPKVDVIENDYWSKGIDTDEIPLDVLAHYLVEGDLDRTERVFKEQVFLFKGINI